MAVKASASVTIIKQRDIDACYWFYKLQSAMGTAPTKGTMVLPSTKGQPPTDTSGTAGTWVDSEPTYTAGDTRILYVVELTYYSDGTAEFSEVSRSSSYDAAMQAYELAHQADETATSANSTASQAAEAIMDINQQLEDIGNSVRINNEAGTVFIGTTGESGGVEHTLSAVKIIPTGIDFIKDDERVAYIDTSTNESALDINTARIHNAIRIGELEIIEFNGGIGVRRV